MITPIPTRVDDAKDAVLWSILNSLEQIDNNTGTRAIWAQSVLFNISNSLDGPVFKEEISQLRQILGIKEEVEEVIEVKTDNEATEERLPREEFMFREL